MNYVEILGILFMHWIADFVLQSDKMAKNKSSSMIWLSFHIAVYTFCFLSFGLKFAVVNGLAHWLIDFCTSRISSKLYQKGDIHTFFVVIGFDQFLHLATLMGTYIHMNNNW